MFRSAVDVLRDFTFAVFILVFILLHCLARECCCILRDNIQQFSFKYLLITYSMEQSLSWEANRFSSSQEIPRILRNPMVHYRIHNSTHLSLFWASPYKSDCLIENSIVFLFFLSICIFVPFICVFVLIL